ncbi:hypothetical protein AB2L27_13925 [Kineococcus sp. LSe6-4]|uniref:Uncharacterized protein n=1 Tax=Kineococcus halophytocola TaxID=3234027 RepID=A0ABV4H2Q0_9ACTN
MFGTTSHVIVLVGAVLLIAHVVVGALRRRRRGEKPRTVPDVLVVIAMTLTAAVQVSALT